jgi:Cu/Ag efflux protein CusF
MKKSMIVSAAFVAAAAISGVAFADDMSGMKMSDGAMTSHSASSSNRALTNATVKGVDATSGMVTLKHEALTNVGMPAMTMAFKAKDAAMLSSVKEGDNVKVRVENVNGTMTIVKMTKQ